MWCSKQILYLDGLRCNTVNILQCIYQICVHICLMVLLYYCLTSSEPLLCLAALSIRLSCAVLRMNAHVFTSVKAHSGVIHQRAYSVFYRMPNVLSYLLFKHGSSRSVCTVERLPLCMRSLLAEKCAWVIMSSLLNLLKVNCSERKVDWCFPFLLYWHYFNITSQYCRVQYKCLKLNQILILLSFVPWRIVIQFGSQPSETHFLILIAINIARKQ